MKLIIIRIVTSIAFAFLVTFLGKAHALDNYQRAFAEEESTIAVESLPTPLPTLNTPKKPLAKPVVEKIEDSPKKIAPIVETVVASSGANNTASGIEKIVRDAAIKYGLNPDYFVGVAICESTLNPNAVNYSYYENGNPSGLFQHLSGYWPARAAAHGYAGASVFNVVANANVTASMFASGSAHLWACA